MAETTAATRPYEIAYAASLHSIDDQATALESLRSRAGTLFAATAVVTSFLGGGALSEGGERLTFVSYATGAVACFVAVALLTLATLLPYRMRFSISAAAILGIVEGEPEPEPVDATVVLREVALQYERMYDRNAPRIRRLVGCLRLAIVCLLAEVGFWIATLVEGTV